MANLQISITDTEEDLSMHMDTGHIFSRCQGNLLFGLFHAVGHTTLSRLGHPDVVQSVGAHHQTLTG